MTTSQHSNSPPPQTQKQQPGVEAEMHPKPQDTSKEYVGSGKLVDRVAIVTGGDSGIGRAVAVAFAKEGADVAIVYLKESEDASTTRDLIEETGRKCLTIEADIGDRGQARQTVDKVIETWGRIDVLVNNAGEQHVRESLAEISEDQLRRTFQTNVFGMFFMTQAALVHMKAGARIVNTTSVTAYQGNPVLLDYSASKGAIVSFTRALAANLAPHGIYVNAVAPGPIWTPLIPSTFSADQVARFGGNTPLKRPGQPDELAACYVLLACRDGSYMTGQTLHPNGGTAVGG
jgi:NAD(P)-dependent dehydrogenase (short-subunit alcohol dehydrogenase family)